MRKIIAAFVLGVVFSTLLTITGIFKPDSYALQPVVAHQGDTLWQIAARHTRPDEDVRDVIGRIMEANGLQSASSLQVGQRLVVPVRVRRGEDSIATAAGRG